MLSVVDSNITITLRLNWDLFRSLSSTSIIRYVYDRRPLHLFMPINVSDTPIIRVEFCHKHLT